MIKGLTDRKTVMFPRLAKIRLGVKRAGSSGTEYPSDVDYFVLTDCPEVGKVFGEKPKKLVAMFASNNLEDNFPTRLEAWKASKTAKMPDNKTPKSVLFCSSDGETATRQYAGDKDVQGHTYVQTLPVDERPDLGEMFTMPCPYEACPYYDNRGCREVGRLNIILPQVSWSGVYQIETSSLWAFGNIRDTVQWMTLIYGGQIAMKPFELSREPVVMTPPELNGKSVIKHVLHLRVIDRHNLPQIPPPPFMVQQTKALLDAPQDRPEDLFPEEAQAALPSVDVPPALPPKKDDLEELAELAGLGKAQFELFKAENGGDIDKMKRILNAVIDSRLVEKDTPPASVPPRQQTTVKAKATYERATPKPVARKADEPPLEEPQGTGTQFDL